MQTYTAGEAIGPAWQHTKALLFRDRRWGRILKLSLVALGAQLNLSFNSFSRLYSKPGTGVPHALAPVLVLLAVVAGIFSLALGVAFLYLGSRLQLTLFDIVLLRDDRVAPAWTRHGHHTWRWAGVKIVGILAIGLLLSPLLIPVIGGVFTLMHTMVPAAGTPSQPPAFHMAAVRAVLILLAELFAVLLLFNVFFRLFLTITLPVLALENLSFTDVFRRAWLFLAAEPGAMAAYALLQTLALFALGIAVLVGWAVAVAIPAAAFGLAGWTLWALLHGSVSGVFLLGTLGTIGGAVLLAWALLTYIVALGFVIVFAEAFSQYFLAGRYPPLAQYLQTALEPAPQLGFRD